MVTRRGKVEPGSNGNNKGKIKFRYMDSERVVDFSVENMTGDSVTEGLHSLADALAGRTLPRAGVPNPKRALEASGTQAEVEDDGEAPELAFTLLGQAPQLPTDVEKPLRNMTYTKTKKWFDKQKGAGNYSINWVGESGVGKMGAGDGKA